MENQRDNLVVIFAGYKECMDTFFSSNPGLSSRVANHIDFPDYSVEELISIAHLMLEKLTYDFKPDAEGAFLEYLELRMRLFEQGGTISYARTVDQV